jgi:hypothetical protein
MFGGNWEITGFDTVIVFHILALMGYFYFKLLFFLLSFIKISIG